MRKLTWLPILSALLFAGVACKDEGPKLISSDTSNNDARPDSDKTASRMQHTAVDGQRDAVLGRDSNATVKTEPADKQALRVQRDAKEANPQQARADEKAQYDQQKQDSLQMGKASADAQSITGQIKSSSDSQVELQSGADQALKLAVDEETAVRIDGQHGKAGQIAEGSEVRASYKTVDGQLKALRLDVTNKPGTKGAEKSPANK